MGWKAIETLSETFHTHPAFEAAMLRHTDGILELRSRIRQTSKLFGKEERCRSFNIFAILAAEAHSLGRPHVALADFLDAAREASVSDRTAKTVASLLPYYRFAELTVDAEDRRRRLLVPSERMWTYMSEWSESTFEALELLGQPFHGDRAAAVMTAFAVAKPNYLKGSLAFFGDDPQFTRVFAYLEGGSLLCMAAVAAALANQPAPSLGEVSDRFSISKAQLARVVAEGRVAGLFTPAAKVTPSPELIRRYGQTVSVVLAFINWHRDAVSPSLPRQMDQAAA